MSAALLTEAQRYLDRGWSVIPTANVPEEKKAAVTWTPCMTSRPSAAKLRKWFALPNITGVAVIFGKVSGRLASRDWDVEGAYERWAQDHAKLAIRLPTARTARGHHVYFRAELERFEDLADGEYRGDSNHYSLLPPSLHPNGVRYAWTIPLPKGELPLIDPIEEGLVPDATERTEKTEITEQTEITEAIYSVGSVNSVLSVALLREIEKTLPHSEGQRNRSIFSLARLLKGIPQFADAAAEQMEPYVREWHRRALPVIGTKPYDETRIDFLVSWDRVKFPPGQGPVEALMRRATLSALPAVANNYDSEGVRKLVGLCSALQVAAGDAVFYLSCRTAAKVLGVPNHETAWRWMMLLKHDGLLVEAEKGKQGRAARYRWLAGGLPAASNAPQEDARTSGPSEASTPENSSYGERRM